MRVKIDLERSSGDEVTVFDEHLTKAEQVDKLRVVVNLILMLEMAIKDYLTLLEE